jgi:hypothetical protein
MTAAVLENPKIPTFVMPQVREGQIVDWFHGGDSNGPPIPAIVTKVNTGHVALNVIQPNITNFKALDGVRHVDDPQAKEWELVEQGGWRHTKDTLSLAVMEKLVAAMGAKLSELEKLIKEKK